MNLLDLLKFKEDGLVPVIIQDMDTGEVLSLRYMNKEALQKSLDLKKAHFWSRSKRRLQMKGEKSGHFELIREIYVDCDEDALLIKVEQIGGACHQGYKSCFYRRVTEGGQLRIAADKIFEPEEVYGGEP